MTMIIKSIHKFEDKFDRRAERFTLVHPYLALLAMFIGVPLFILMAVAAATMVITFPVGCVLGWL